MALRTIEHHGVEYQYESVFFTLTSGEKFSDLFPYDPVLLKELELNTMYSVVDYFIANRDALKEYSRLSSTANIRWRKMCERMSKYVDRTYDRSDSMTRDEMMTFVDRGYQSFTIALDPRVSGSGPFLLATPDEPESEEPQLVKFHFGYHGHITLKFQSIAEENRIPDMWDGRKNYTFKMDPTRYEFFRRTPRCSTSEDQMMFGLELELNTRLSATELQHIVMNVEPKQELFFIFKHDGSITGRYDNAMELVTVPCTPRYLRTNFRIFFDKLHKLARAKNEYIEDYFDVSQDLGNGIHIHVDRNIFLHETHRRKFTAVWHMQDERSLELLQQLSHRARHITEHEYCMPIRRVAQRSVSYKLRHADADFRSQRNTTCNSSNDRTLEVRLFQGIFELEHVLRCIDTVEAVVDFTRDASNRIVGGGRFRPSPFPGEFKRFVLGNPGYKYLKQELKACA